MVIYCLTKYLDFNNKVLFSFIKPPLACTLGLNTILGIL